MSDSWVDNRLPVRRFEALPEVVARLSGVVSEVPESEVAPGQDQPDDGLTDFQRQWLSMEEPGDSDGDEPTDGVASEPHWWEGIPAVRQLLLDGLDPGAGTVFIGENGSGKSTLIEGLAIAYGVGAEGGSTGSRHRTRPSESGLGEQLTLIRNAGAGRSGYFLRAETMHGLFSYLEANPSHNPEEPRFHELSHGESFVALVELNMKLRRPGIYFLDEPESALSFDNQLRLLRHLQELMASGRHQIVMATHSPLLAALPGADLFEVDADGFRQVDHDDATLVRKWRDFMNHPARYLD